MSQPQRPLSKPAKDKEAEGFGAIRLPAVAAAAQQARRQPAEVRTPKEWPPFLRKEDIFS